MANVTKIVLMVLIVSVTTIVVHGTSALLDFLCHVGRKKTTPNYFSNNCVKPLSIFDNFWHTYTSIFYKMENREPA